MCKNKSKGPIHCKIGSDLRSQLSKLGLSVNKVRTNAENMPYFSPALGAIFYVRRQVTGQAGTTGSMNDGRATLHYWPGSKMYRKSPSLQKICNGRITAKC